MTARLRLAALAAVAVLVMTSCIADDPVAVDDAAMSDDAASSDDGAATGSDDAPTADDATAADDPAGQAVPVEIGGEFVEGPCSFAVLTAIPPRCGTVAVPMDWATGTGEVTLAVAVYPSTAADPAPDPVVYLDGGPGSHAIESTQLNAAALLEPLQARGDVIVFDQRGAGLSEPNLACDEITALTRELEDQITRDRAEEEQRFHAALTQCRDRLVADGVDLAAYHTINNANDVEAIRLALGYDQWNLLGISYGTRLGLEVLRQHPDGVRTAVLDSVFPPQVDSARENPSTFLASFDAVVAACAAEPACAATGDLGDRLAAVAQQLEASPVEVEVSNLLTATTDNVFVDGDAIVGVVNQALYSPLMFGDLPELVAELERGEVAAIEQYLSQFRTVEAFFTDGMFYSIVCNEEIAFADRAEVEAALPPDPYGLTDSFDFASNTGTSAFGTCEAFGSTPQPAIANEPVTSDVPALVLAGRFDPVTPVAWSEAAAEGLANSHLVVDANGSHGISPGECGMAIVTAFLDDPSTRPDTACLDETTVSFLEPVDTSVTLETVSGSLPSGRELVTVRPEAWTHGQLPGDSYRQASFLDQTQLIQIAESPAIALGLELYLDQLWGVALGPSEDRPGIGGRDWRRRTGANGGTAVEWYETEIDGVGVVVLLVAAEGELAATADAVLVPALEGIDLR